MTKVKKWWLWLSVFLTHSLFAGTGDLKLDDLTGADGKVIDNLEKGGKSLAGTIFNFGLWTAGIVGLFLIIAGGVKLSKDKQQSQGAGLEDSMKAIGAGIFLVVIVIVIRGLIKS